MTMPATRVTRGARVSLAVLVVLCLAACGGDDGDRGSDDASSTDTDTTQGRRPNPSVGPRATGEAGSELTRGLLRIEDMPGGWQFNAESAGSPEDTDICGQNLATLEQHRQKLGEAAVGFQESEGGPFFAETLVQYPPGLAERVMNDLTAAVQTCPEVTIRDDEGSLSTWQLTPLTFPQFGDQTLAFREYWSANGVEAIVVYIRRGDYVMVLLHIAINDSVDRIQTETLVSRAYERFSRLGTGR